MIIDFHTHIFPDQIAKDAIPFLEKEGDVKAHLDGTKAGLLASMEKYAIQSSVICSIATKPEQFTNILDWSAAFNSDRLIAFASIHPDDPESVAHVHAVKEMGFKGIKMHPYYQDFFINEEKMAPIYNAISQTGLILLMHTGFDIAFPRIKRADPAKTVAVQKQFPNLKLVTSHLGAWDQWDEVQKTLVGKPIYMDISFSLNSLDRETARKIICNHPQEYILFGSDSPWEDQGKAIQMLEELDLERELLEKIKGGNAQKLLNG